MAEACLFVANLPRDVYLGATLPARSHLNVGSGEDLTILELATMIAGVSGFRGAIRCDTSKPDGAPRKLLDVSAMARLGWRARIPLELGIARTHEWYVANLTLVNAESGKC